GNPLSAAVHQSCPFWTDYRQRLRANQLPANHQQPATGGESGLNMAGRRAAKTAAAGERSPAMSQMPRQDRRRLLPSLACCTALLAGLWQPLRAQEQAEIFVQLGHTDLVRSVAFSPDGRLLASVAQEGGVKLWDVAGGREITTLQGDAMGYFSVV